MKQENMMTEAQSLEVISSMINKAKNRFSENGFLYLLWGWAVLICSTIEFILPFFIDYKNPGMVWTGLWLVIVYQIFYAVKKEKKVRVRTYTDEITGYIWMSFFFAIMISLFICIYTKRFELILPFLLVLYGIPTFITGGLMKFRPLTAGGICCFVLGAISPFIQSIYYPLLIDLAIIAAWLIPGYILRNRFKKAEREEYNYEV